MVTILVVDDDLDLRETLEEILETEGYSVLSAGDGEQALPLLENNAIDLVICDYEMPSVNGVEVLTHVRSHAETQSLAFIMMSGAQRPSVDLDFEFIRKPFHIEELLEIIKSIS